jgi:sulfofructose kinase
VANEIIAVGMTCYDHVVVVPSFDRVARGCRALDVLCLGGGVAATAGVAARALGARVQLWARVGDDGHGEFLVEGLRRRGVDTSELQIVEGARTAVSTVLVEESTGERQFLFYPGSGLDAGWQPPDYTRIDRCRAVIVDGRWPGVCLASVRRARARAVPIVADLGHGSEEEMEILKLADFPIISEVCFEELSKGRSVEALADELLAGNALAVTITRGPRGVWLKERKGPARELPAFDVRVVDTTGAGDIFHGAFAYALGAGKTPRECAEFASAAAAFSCTALGGRGAVPTRDDVEPMLGEDSRPRWSPAAG